MKKFNPNKNIIIALIVVIAVVLLVSVTATQRNQKKDGNVVQSVTNDFVAIVDKGLSFPVKGVQNVISSIQNLFNTYEENDQLKRRIDELESLRSENRSYKEENEQLKEQLGLDSTLSNYERITASVIDRSPDSWQNIFIIDKGKSDGIEVDMPVMGRKSLVGRIISVDNHSSKVELLTTSNQNVNHFPVMITPKEGNVAYGLLEEYNPKENAFVVKQLTSTDGLQVGDEVATSGLGGKSPRGLFIGTVKSIEANQFGLEKEMLVTPAASTYELTTVTVIKKLAGRDS